jgi:hypothetical protein
VPALATLGAAAGVLFLPAAAAAVLARGRAAVLALAGAAWIALVALMSQAGFSGEPRYLLPGAALLAVGGAVAAARLPRGAAAVALAAVVAIAAVPRASDLADLGPRLRYQHDLAADLDDAIAAAGGRDAILACGRPGGRPLPRHAARLAPRRPQADGPRRRRARRRHLPLAPHRAVRPVASAPRRRRRRERPVDRLQLRQLLLERRHRREQVAVLLDAREHLLGVEDEQLGVAGVVAAWTSSHVIGVETVGRSLARSE